VSSEQRAAGSGQWAEVKFRTPETGGKSEQKISILKFQCQMIKV
jgi:hypothetical protein